MWTYWSASAATTITDPFALWHPLKHPWPPSKHPLTYIEFHPLQKFDTTRQTTARNTVSKKQNLSLEFGPNCDLILCHTPVGETAILQRCQRGITLRLSKCHGSDYQLEMGAARIEQTDFTAGAKNPPTSVSDSQRTVCWSQDNSLSPPTVCFANT